MQKKLKFILGVLSCVTVVQSPAQETSLWYDAPADEWMKSLPVGNGRVGAMVFGGVDEETVALNESSMGPGNMTRTKRSLSAGRNLTNCGNCFSRAN